ncbi:hypothetical protein LZ190_13465 [Rhodovulum sulfidophilum]|nr:hypothetical protein [Rhodovulum sulfidophilum]
MCDIREFIQTLGGCRAVAERVGAKYTTMHSHLAAGLFPAKYYDALCALALEAGCEPPSRRLFSFVRIPEANRSNEINALSDREPTGADDQLKWGST